jgi:light-regulated signal transduction histidine kinase (bacteriophytochrome)
MTKILVVDDEPGIRLAAKSILERQGWSVVAASRGEEALSAIEEQPDVDVVLLDLMMPGIDGYEVLRVLKSSPETAEISVIALTALDATEEKVRAFAGGVSDYIGKPFDREELVARVETQVKIAHTTRQLREARDGLERRVEERTMELAKANETLQVEVAERKRTEEMLARYAEELKRSNTELEQFAYIASHDLQEPLRMVKSYLKLLEKRYKGKLDSDADDFIYFAVDGATRMQSLIEGLLAYSRVSTRGGDFEPVNCEVVLDHALRNLVIAVEDSGAEVTHDPLPQVSADELQLGQLFQNLVGNAIKFHGADPPRVHISAEDRSGEWVFSVSDNGIGFDPEQTERAFSIFQRLHTGDRQYEGSGIGLALCRRIVERHGGRIWAESEPGEGSVFHFALPGAR